MSVIVLLFLQGNWTALHYCAYYGQEDVAGMLLDRGAHIDALTNVSLIDFNRIHLLAHICMCVCQM